MCGERSGALGCAAAHAACALLGGSCSSRAVQGASLPMDILAGVSTRVFPELSSPHGALADTVGPAGLLSVFPLTAGSTSSWFSLWPLLLMAVGLFWNHPSSGSPCSPSSVAESCVWEPWAALRCCQKQIVPSALPCGCLRALHGGVTHPTAPQTPWHLCHQHGLPGAVRSRVNHCPRLW